MKNKFMALVLPLMMVASLTGCNNSNNNGAVDYNKFCEDAVDAAPLLMDSSTGKEIFASATHVRDLSDYNSVLALNTYVYKEKELKLTWEADPADNWVVSPYVLDASRTKYAPKYDSSFEASLKCTVSYVENEKVLGSKEVTWKFNVIKATSVEKTLREINEEYVANDYKLGDLANGSIATRGIITGSFEHPDHVYAGVFIQDGEYALQLYASKLEALWNENSLKVGDCIFVVGKLSIYGVIELGPNFIEVIDKATYNIADPVTIDAATKDWTKESLMPHQSALVTLASCVYSDGNVKSSASHATINFKHGDDTIAVYCNYHIGKPAMEAIKTLVEGYTKDQTTVTVKGILSFYDDAPQIIPLSGASSFVAAA